MYLRLSAVVGALVCASFLVLSSSPCSAQFVIGGGRVFNGGVFNDGGWSSYGGVTSVEIFDGYGGRSAFSTGVVAPYPVWGGGPLPAYGGYGYGYGYGYGGPAVYGGPFVGGYALPPLVIPAETFYGPGAVRRMMGIDPPLGTPIINQTVVAPATPSPANNFGFGVNARGPRAAPGGNVPPANVVATNAATKQRARKSLDAGDAAFAQQRFADAYASYKDAVRTAPDLVESYFRQAAAAVALSRYDEAVAAIKLGLRIDPTAVDSRFRFSALYGAGLLARQQHLDALADAVNDRPTAELLFLQGVVYFFDDPPQRAEPYFQRAAALTVGDAWFLRLFDEALEKMPPAAVQPVDAAKPILPAVPVGLPVGDDGARDI